MKRSAAVSLGFLAALCGAPVEGQETLSRAPGVSAATAYQVGELDAINLFNGSLTLRLALGPEYKIGPELSLSFGLTYVSNGWHNELRHCNDANGMHDYGFPIPDARMQAGFGWHLGLGRLYAPDQPPFEAPFDDGGDAWTYVAPDASSHRFFTELREGHPASPDLDTMYSQDGSLLRMKRYESTQTPPESSGCGSKPASAPSTSICRTVEHPDGTIQAFWRFDAATTSMDWRLTRTSDRFGNRYDVVYTATGWAITDSHDRDYTVNLSGGLVTSLDLPAFGGQTATFTFTHVSKAIDRQDFARPLQCPEVPADETNKVTVPLLVQITLPDGSFYAMRDDLGNPAYQATDVATQSGGLKRLRLPTGGRYEWTYTSIAMVFAKPPEPNLPGDHDIVYGVASKSVADTGGTSIGTWTYDYTTVANPPFWSGSDGPCFHTTTVRDPLGNDSVHYFSLKDTGDPFQGLPFSFCNTATGVHLSGPYYPSEELWQGAAGSGIKLRTIEVGFDAEIHSAGAYYANHPLLTRRRETFHDDGGKTREIVRTENDGLGHLRTTTERGFGVASDRVTFVDYNPAAMELKLGADGREAGDSSFVIPPPTQPWILGTSTLTRVTQGASTAVVNTCFDSSTGFLERRWAQAGATAGAHDLVAVYEAANSGHVAEMRLYGGDDKSLTPGSDLCAGGLGSSTATQTVTFSYASGALRRRSLLDSSLVELLRTLDLDVDASTGLPSKSRDPAGVATTITYDVMGRLTSQSISEGARSEIVYVLPTTGTPSATPKLTLLSCAGFATACDRTGALSWRETEYDGLGRPIVEKIEYPGGSGGVIAPPDSMTRTYDALGRVLTESVWGNTGKKTTYSGYDRFGRPASVTLPDGKTSTFSYAGERVATRSAVLALAGGDGIAFTTELRDAFGRLTEVCEGQSSGWSGNCPTTAIDTRYTFDLADRLISVCGDFRDGSCTQSRAFNYDQRGFLISEVHPEIGPAGKGTALYSYDAAGSVLSKKIEVASSSYDFHLKYRYDPTGRLIFVDEETSAGTRRVKEFTYGRNNAGSDLRKGKLVQAKRYNWVDVVGPLALFGSGGSLPAVVTDRYVYDDDLGRVSKRQTSYQLLTTHYAWETGFAYDQLGNVSQLTYPRCLHGPCAGTDPVRNVTFNYLRGFLSDVPSFATAFGYQAGGMLRTIDHTNGIQERIRLDSDDMPRPRSFETIGVVGGDWNTGTYVYDGAGNVKTIGTLQFRYDRLSRLLSGQAPEGLATHNQSIAYDNLGNITSMTTDGAARTLSTNTATNRLSISGAAYDAAGDLTNLSLSGETYQYRYDGLSMMRSLQSNTGLARVFVYDADDERLGQFDCVLVSGSCATTPKETWTLRGPDNQVLRTYEKDIAAGGKWSWKEDQVNRQGKILAFVRPDGLGGESVFHVHLDHLGSIRLTTDQLGNRVEEKSYAPYGKVFGSGSASKASFTGHEKAGAGTAGELDYMHARYYAPALGRFVSADRRTAGPLGKPQSRNRYSYAFSSPLGYSDPDGNESRAAIALEQDIRALAKGEITIEQYNERIEMRGKGAIMAAGLFVPGPEDIAVLGVAAVGRRLGPSIASRLGGLFGRLFKRIFGKADDVAASTPKGQVVGEAGQCAECTRKLLADNPGSRRISTPSDKVSHHAAQLSDGTVVDPSLRDNLQTYGVDVSDIPADKTQFTYDEWRALVDRLPDFPG